jgi:Ca2+-binding RTX toxin-like protein
MLGYNPPRICPMATPYANAVSITRLSLSGLTQLEAALIDGSKWGGGYGSGITLTYSFPWASGTAPYYSFNYSSDNEWYSSSGLNQAERSAVIRALNSVEEAANIRFSAVEDDTATVGELRFTETDRSGYAHAYLPSGNAVASGDVWFSRSDWNPGGASPKAGSYEYMTILHEIGHALGLKHPFESGRSGTVLASSQDHYQWTIMSYTAYEGAGNRVWADFNPTTLMYLDLVALEKLYGPSSNANRGNTRYVFHDDRTYWETISDSSGVDTIVYSSDSRDGVIDLSNDDFSRMGRAVTFSDGAKTFDTIRFGPSTVIENATGGDGDDILTGNSAKNALKGSDGDDELRGGGKADELKGGAGADTLEGGGGSDTLIGGGGKDSLAGGDGNDLLYHEQAGDTLTDSGGTDTVLSMLADYTLGDEFENLTLGDAALDGTGNGLNNVIEGNGSANALAGAVGADSLSGGDGNDALDGGAGDDTLLGGIGDDTLDGGDGIDRLSSGKGADTLVWDPGDSLVNGGGGIDTLLLTQDLDLTEIAGGIILNIEQIDLVAAVANLLTLAEQDILDMFGGTLTVLGDATDTVDIVDAFTPGAEADGFRTYTVGTATLLIDTDIANVA